MRIAVDAMGGDFAPAAIVGGAVQAAQTHKGIEALYLVGDQTAIQADLDRRGDIPGCVQVVHASEVIAMTDSPAASVRRKRDSSITRAIELVRDGKADAMVSAGNTGAAVASAALRLRTLEGVDRPGIAAVLPTRKRPVLLMDAGATIDCTPRNLAQFAAMGSIYSREVLGHKNPVVGVLSVGGEDVKGTDTTKETLQLLADSDLNSCGHVEGHDLFEGETDVIVCDGFIGNAVLKSSESAAITIRHWLKESFTKNLWRKLGALMLTGAFKEMKQKMDPDMIGGAPLLGANGIVIIAHGASSETAIENSIHVACSAIEHHVNPLMIEEVAKINALSD